MTEGSSQPSATSDSTLNKLKQGIRNIPDFPKPGIQFKDITPLLADGRLFRMALEQMIGSHQPDDIDLVVGIDARGFIFGAAAAAILNAGFVPIRKQGKLPFETIEQSYDLEYGSNTIAMHRDAVLPGQRVLLLDDLLATGGTAAAALELLQQLQAQVVEAVFLVELEFLSGRKLLGDVPVRSIIAY